MTTYVSATSIYVGTPILFTTDPAQEGSLVGKPTPFTALNGTIVDPDTVTFACQVQGQSVLQHTYSNPGGDPSGMIIRSGIGLYYIVIPTTVDGTMTWQWSCASVGGADSTRTETSWSSSVFISPLGVAL